MFREHSLRVAAFAALSFLILGPVAARAQSAAPPAHKQTTAAAKKQSQLEPKAIEVLQAVSNRLAAVHTLSFVAVETSESLSRQGTQLVSRRRSEVTLQRPDKLRVILSGNGPRSQVYCNGNTMMTYSPDESALVIEKAPPTINQCLRDASKASAIDFPFIDLILSDPSSGLISGLKHARSVGQSQAVGRTNTDIVEYSRDGVFVQMWVGTEDKLPRAIHATDLDDPNRLRHDLVLSDWQIDVPVRPDVFTSLNAAGAEHMDSAQPQPVGTSGVQPAPRVRPLTIHTFAPKYWGYGETVQTTPYGAAGYYQSPDGYGFYPPAYYGYYPPATAGYGAQCYDCGYDWATERSDVDTAAAGFNIALTTSGRYNAGAATSYNQPASMYAPGQIVTTLPAGCAAPYVRGAAFYLCGNTWFSGVYGPDGKLYFRAISVP